MSSPETGIDAEGPETPGSESQQQEKPKLSLEIQVDKPGPCQRHVTVVVSREDVDRYLDEAYTELMPNAAVPGFRAGRAPRKLVEHRFRDQIADQVKGSLLMDAMTQISDEHDFSAISEPQFDFGAIEIPESGPLKFEFDLEVRPEFDLPQWKGLQLDQLSRTFTSQDVDHQLQKLLSDHSELVLHEGPAELNDFLVVNIWVRHQGELIAEAQQETIQLQPILSFPDARLEGFDKLMTGVVAGERRTARVMVSHDAPREELQGETVELEIEVVEVRRVDLAELDDELLRRLGDYQNEGELRDRIQEDLERRMAYQQQRRIRRQITALLTQSADWELPPDLVKRQARRELERAMLEMRSSGFGGEEIKAHEHELRQNSLNSTKMALQEHFILERIAEDEQIEAEPGDYDTEIELLALQAREPVRRVRARIEKKGLMDTLRNQIIERKVLDLIRSHAHFRDVKYEPERSETATVDFALSGRVAAEIPAAKHAGESQPLPQPVDRS
jgi:trigger factor